MKYITIFTFAIFMLLACGGKRTDTDSYVVRFASYRDIPGVTESEIAAIETMREQGKSFIYGMLSGTEAFQNSDGELRGFAALVCEYLTELFDMPFKPAVFDWDSLMSGLVSGEIDFSGELTPTEERLKTNTFFMTDPIILRTIKTYRITGSRPLPDIAAARILRFAFLEGSSTDDDVRAVSTYSYETVFVDNYHDAYKLLKSGEIDAFLEENTAEYTFGIYGDVTAEHFFPLVIAEISITTRNPSLVPIISVVQKMLEANGRSYLTRLYGLGEMEFLRYKFDLSLTDVEREYLRSRQTVSVAAETDNYPISFYNNHEKQYQGVFIDILREIEEFIGLTFEIVNAPNTDWEEQLEMLENGSASMISELIRTESRAGHFLWPQTPTLTDYFALLSLTSQPYANVNEIMDMRVALESGTAQAETFRKWFPNHANTIEVPDMTTAFAALENGSAHLIMSAQNALLAMTNYMERPGFKINILFDHTYQSHIGFNKDKEVLCSIIDKALRQIDLQRISDRWVRKTFDYRVTVAQSRLPWLIGALVLLLCVIILLIVIDARGKSEVKRLGAMAAAAKKLLQGDTEFIIAEIPGSKSEIKLISGALQHAGERIRVLTKLRQDALTAEISRLRFDIFVSEANCVSQAFKMAAAVLMKESNVQKITAVYKDDEPAYSLTITSNGVSESQTFPYHQDVAALLADKKIVYLNPFAIRERGVDFINDKTQSVCVLSLTAKEKSFGYIILESENELSLTGDGALWQSVASELSAWLLAHEDAPITVGAMSDNKGDVPIAPYRAIDGIDADSAVASMGGDEEMYANSLRLFVKLLPEMTDKADAALRDANMKSFAIEAHSMKGALNNIGAYLAGDVAAALEDAAKKDDNEYCEKNYPALVSQLAKLCSQIETAMPASDEEKPQGDIYALKHLLAKANDAAEEFDTLECKEQINEAAKFSYDTKTDSMIADITAALDRFDCAGAQEHINKLIETVSQ